MKTTTKQIKSSDIAYNPALNRFQGKVIFKEKLLATEAFIKKHGLPEQFMKKGDS